MIKINKADEVFSDFIRTRDNWECVRCLSLGKRSVFRPPQRLIRFFPQFEDRTRNAMALHNMHCFSRGGYMLRFNPLDCLAGCYGCHSYLDRNPLEKYEFFKSQIGEEKFAEIKILSKQALTGISKSELEERVKKEFGIKFLELVATKGGGIL